ncbi:thiolase [Novosphingobium bradum]|uniref:Thiolase n=1 Tax=Novosphingobium bradum TaxID=1737444 RepID=A0ABV7IPD9_9SPHN
MLKPGSIAVVGAAETTELGVIPGLSQLGLHLDAALNAMADAGLKPSDIDGVATAGEDVWTVANMLGIAPKWVDGTNVGGCSYMLHVRHAAAAIDAGLCTTVLITHGESGRSQVGRAGYAGSPASLFGQFEGPYGVTAAPSMFTIPVLRYLKETGSEVEDLARVAVIQREWAQMNPRAFAKKPLTVDDVMAEAPICWPFSKSLICLVTDGGGALILTSAERAKDFPTRPVYILGTGESTENPNISQMEDFTSSRAFRMSGKAAFESSGITHGEVDHLMIYDAMAHLPLYGLGDLGFCKPDEAKDFFRERRTAPGGALPMNTNGGGLSYMHSGMYGMYALQESVRQMRGIAPAQVEGAKISVCHGVGRMFTAAGTIVFGNDV